MSVDTIESTEEAVAATQAAAWSSNVKALFEQHIHDVQREKNQFNDWHTFALEQARNHAQIVNRLAQGAATVSERLASDGANFSAMLASSAATAQARIASTGTSMDTIASFNGMTKLTNAEVANNRLSADVVADFKDVAKAAVAATESAQAAYTGYAAGSGPMPMGTAGFNQGALQTGASTADVAMMTSLGAAVAAMQAQIAKLADTVNVLLLKVASDVAIDKS